MARTGDRSDAPLIGTFGGSPDFAADLTELGNEMAQLVVPPANFAALPTAKNWVGRRLPVADTGAVYEWFGGGWVLIARPATAWTNLALASGWSNQATNPYAPLRYMIDQSGRLRLQGQVATRTGYGVTEAFATLPVGARPPVTVEIPVVGNGTNPRTFNSVLINTNGTLNLYGPVTAAFNIGEPSISLV